MRSRNTERVLFHRIREEKSQNASQIHNAWTTPRFLLLSSLRFAGISFSSFPLYCSPLLSLHFPVISLLSVDRYNGGIIELGSKLLFTTTKSNQTEKLSNMFCLSVSVNRYQSSVSVLWTAPHLHTDLQIYPYSFHRSTG